MAIPQTDHKESLQALAFAMRQEKNGDITADEIRSNMMLLNGVDPAVRRSCAIDYGKMNRDFALWVEQATTVKAQKALDEWINSSMWVANKIIPSSYIKGNGYIFYQSGLVPDFRNAFKEIAKDIGKNSTNTIVKRVYAVMGKGTGDKWNPADILAIKSAKVNSILRQMGAFKNGNPNLSAFKDAKTISEQNKLISQSAKTNQEKKSLHLIEDMGNLYWYNQFIDMNYKSGDCVPISLKKVMATSREIEEVTTPNVNIKSFDHKEAKGVKAAVNLDLKITSVEFKPATQKCIVNFTLAGETGHFMDIRGTESSRKIADVQMQLQKGTAANHGKATLPAFSLITKLSKGRLAVSRQQAKKREIFRGIRIPRGTDHMFTDWRIFDDYARRNGRNNTFSQLTLLSHLQKWASYIDFLSNGKHRAGQVIGEFDSFYSQGPFKAAKYLKNKVQSYEVGMVLDASQTQISALVKENIMKSVYSQAASKGFRIFGDNKITDYMSASSYLKVGG